MEASFGLTGPATHRLCHLSRLYKPKVLHPSSLHRSQELIKMSPKFIVIFGLFLVLGSAYAQCNRGNISACTAANTQCLSLSGQHDFVTSRCDCTEAYGQCLLNIRCDPTDTEGDWDNDDPGNAINEFRAISASCTAFGCGTTGICGVYVPPVGAPSSATSLMNKEVAGVMVAAATIVMIA